MLHLINRNNDTKLNHLLSLIFLSLRNSSSGRASLMSMLLMELATGTWRTLVTQLLFKLPAAPILMEELGMAAESVLTAQDTI